MIDKVTINGFKIDGTFYEFQDKATNDLITDNTNNILNKVYPVGSIFWTFDRNWIPGDNIGGIWLRLKDCFIRAVSDNKLNGWPETVDSDSVEDWLKEYKNGSDTITLEEDNLPAHTHELIDPGHEHGIQTFGDDYNGSNKNGQLPNFVKDGVENMLSANLSHGLIAVTAETGIKIETTGKNTPVDSMPAHYQAYAWVRVA